MAGVATHIRIAIGLKEKYRVKDIRKYIAGTIYPDSRYVTGIDRSLTHPSDYLDWHWETADDFKKGWLVHLLVDEIQCQVEKENFPHIFESKTGQDSEAWVRRTTLKILQDLEDLKGFDIKPILPYLEFTENPNVDREQFPNKPDNS